MKKTAVFLIFLSVLLIAAMFPSADTEPFKTNVVPKNASYNKFTTFEYGDAPTVKIEDYFKDFPEIFDFIKEYHEDLINTIPNDIRMRLKENGVVIHYVEDCRDYYGSNPPKFLFGFFVINNKKIFVSVQSDDIQSAMTSMNITAYHEIGHAVATIYGYIDETKEFRAAYKKDINEHTQLVPVENSSECFAEVFKLYMFAMRDDIGSKISLQKEYPETSGYMREKLGFPLYLEGCFYDQIRFVRFAIVKPFWTAQKVEESCASAVNNMKGPILAADILRNTEWDAGIQSLKTE